MKIKASFVQDGKWWVGWTDDVPGALTQGATLEPKISKQPEFPTAAKYPAIG